ncbi:hypothetical protein BUALT_Bualt05G0118300 [Buddleja alternifolia]|uniref:Chromo domain-containing protein n=1 Tax=Buddleja alternifolia TaxID=168488 RepID=A0AAV6XRP6_9LAMI|nr:hypothetical protein BUALT_Bualt05G0118300 [Buddleja alternifolia]
MNFMMNGKKVSLRGKQPPSVETISNKQMNKILQAPAQISLMYVGLMNHSKEKGQSLLQLEHQPQESTGNDNLDALLTDFADLFEDPTSLPPQRLYDHVITLREGTGAVNVKPYRYPAVQKNEIEKIIQEMLDTGVLDRQIAQKDNHVITQVLVKWFNAPKKDSTWENLYELQLRFPDFHP